MFNLDKQKPNASERRKKWWLLSTIFLIIIIVFLIADFAFQKSFDQKVFLGVKVGYLNVSAKTKTEVISQLKLFWILI